MSCKPASKLYALRLSLPILFLSAVLGTSVLAQTAQHKSRQSSTVRPAMGASAGAERRVNPRAAVAYTPVNGITVTPNPDPDSADPAPQTSPTPGTDTARPPRRHPEANVSSHKKQGLRVNTPVTIKAGDPFVLVLTTQDTYAEYIEYGVNSGHSKVFDPLVTLKLYRQDGTFVRGYNMPSDTDFHNRLRLISGETKHILPLYGRFFATRDLKKPDGTNSLTAGSRFVLHVFRHLAYGGSDADQSIAITIN